MRGEADAQSDEKEGEAQAERQRERGRVTSRETERKRESHKQRDMKKEGEAQAERHKQVREVLYLTFLVSTNLVKGHIGSPHILGLSFWSSAILGGFLSWSFCCSKLSIFNLEFGFYIKFYRYISEVYVADLQALLASLVCLPFPPPWTSRSMPQCFASSNQTYNAYMHIVLGHAPY